ncbi:hypothetical protein TPY_2388 [Sulfobacillus acidophilus TPY]|nr:hypothetical protein TPY_2388 [Sulfobacillus acidophilus TPY]
MVPKRLIVKSLCKFYSSQLLAATANFQRKTVKFGDKEKGFLFIHRE